MSILLSAVPIGHFVARKRHSHEKGDRMSISHRITRTKLFTKDLDVENAEWFISIVAQPRVKSVTIVTR